MQSYGSRDFYSYFYAIRCGESRYRGSGSDAIYRAASFPRFLRVIAELADCATRPTPATPSGPPRYRPTPTVTSTPVPRSGQ